MLPQTTEEKLLCSNCQRPATTNCERCRKPLCNGAATRATPGISGNCIRKPFSPDYPEFTVVCHECEAWFKADTLAHSKEAK